MNVSSILTPGRIVVGAISFCVGCISLMATAQAAEPAAEPGRPQREEVVVERRVVVRDGEEPRRGRVREPGQNRELAELREFAANLHREGKHEQAESVEREIEQMERNRPGRERRREPQPGGEIGELQRRLNHLRIAAENLHAAGMRDLAMETEQRAEATQRELEERARRGRPVAEGPHDEVERLRHELEEVRAQLEAIRREVRPEKER